MNEIETQLAKIWAEDALISLTLSDPRRRDPEDIHKVVARPVLARGQQQIQCAYHFVRKVTHQNFSPEEARAHLVALLTEKFQKAQIYTATADVHLLVNAQGKTTVRARPPSKQKSEASHDRPKHHLLPEGQPCDFLQRLGVMDAAGKVIAAKRDKFRQINRYLEMVANVMENFPAGQPLTVVDFGCGKAYLTFALYHYLRHQKGYLAQIIGVDARRDLMEEGNRIAADLGYSGLRFVAGTIQSFAEREQADMVVSLHACDTATDDALLKAIAWDAKVVLAAPCCQKELSPQLHNEAMRPLLKHGILRERLAALITDGLRAEFLETKGYAVQIVEFIETEHTPKNLLLRAVKRDNFPQQAKREEEYRAFRDFWRVTPYLEEALSPQKEERAPGCP